MGNKRLELRDGWAWLVLGKEQSRARTHFISRNGKAYALFGYDKEWQEAFELLRPTDRDMMQAYAYYQRLEYLIQAIEDWNDTEHVNEVLYGEMDLIEIDEAVYKLREILKDILEKAYSRLKARLKAQHEKLFRASHIEAEYGQEIVWKDMPRRELLQELQYGRLQETAETKTLYEMYDDGYRWEA